MSEDIGQVSCRCPHRNDSKPVPRLGAGRRATMIPDGDGADSQKRYKTGGATGKEGLSPEVAHIRAERARREHGKPVAVGNIHCSWPVDGDVRSQLVLHWASHLAGAR